MATRDTIIVEGIAHYPKITKPDTFGQFADGKFKTGLKITGEALKLVEATIKKAAAEAGFKKGFKHPLKTDEETGDKIVNAASQYKPPVFDAKNKPLPDSVKIGGGSRLQLMLAVNANAKNNRVNFYLNGVQVVELVEYVSKGNGESPFAARDDGFAYEGEAAEGDDMFHASDDVNESDDSDGDPYEL